MTSAPAAAGSRGAAASAPAVESFNDWRGRGCHIFPPVLGEDGTKIAPPGNIFDQFPGEIS